MKTVAIYVDDVDINVGPIFKSDYYQRAYAYLYSCLDSLGAKIVIVHDQDNSYLGNGIFKWYWTPKLSESQLASFSRIDEQVQVPFIFDKARFAHHDVPVISPKEIVEICTDKYKTYLFLPDLHPRTVRADNSEALVKILDDYNDKDMIVVKSVDSSGGRDVYIGEVEKFSHNLNFPAIVQEFIDGDVGIDGIVDGRHDLRVAIFDGEILYGRLRMPPKGGYIASLSNKGGEEILYPSEIPKELVELTSQIDAKFNLGEEHRFFAVDYMRANDRWYVIEMNAWPGLLDPSKGERFRYTAEILAQKLITL